MVRSAFFTPSLLGRTARRDRTAERRAALGRPFAAEAAGPRMGVTAAPEAVQRALDRLPDEHRTVLRLINVERLTYQEAADRLGIARDTLMERLIHARRSFSVALAETSAN